jgi:hypothetical protein
MNIWEENIDEWEGDDYDQFFSDNKQNLNDFDELADEDELDIEDIDFSNISGKNTHEKLKKISRKTSTAKVVPKKKRLAPANSKSRKIIADKNVKYKFNKIKGKQTITTMQLPDDREIILKGVDEFILSQNNAPIKNIGYYKGEKLEELILIINNDTPIDFTIEFFNPSSPLDYLYATTDNLNNRIQVAGDNKISYSDLLFNILANPILIPNAKFVATGLQANAQFNQAMIFKNKNIAGHQKVMPIQNSLNIDIDQNQKQIVYWDLQKTLGRVYSPNGMDVMEYTILAGNQVVFGFYYKQLTLNKVFLPELRNKGIL